MSEVGLLGFELTLKFLSCLPIAAKVIRISDQLRCLRLLTITLYSRLFSISIDELARLTANPFEPGTRLNRLLYRSFLKIANTRFALERKERNLTSQQNTGRVVSEDAVVDT